MTKKELIYFMVANDATLTLKVAEGALNSFVECINKAMARGENVRLPGFGTFSVIRKAERKGRNPQNGEELKIPAKNYAKFKPGSDLKEAAKLSTAR